MKKKIELKPVEFWRLGSSPRRPVHHRSMTKEEAQKIFQDWKGNIELLEKIFVVFPVIPESFLPYDTETLEEALNIIAEDYFDQGDKRTARNIQELAVLHMGGLYITPEGVTNRKLSDEEVLLSMKERVDFILKNPELKKAILNNLREAAESWRKVK